MSVNLVKRIITSICLLSLLIIVIFSNQLIFISTILIIGLVICVESNNIFLKSLSLKSGHNFFSKKISVYANCQSIKLLNLCVFPVLIKISGSIIFFVNKFLSIFSLLIIIFFFLIFFYRLNNFIF